MLAINTASTHYYFVYDSDTEYCDERVCLSVCLSVCLPIYDKEAQSRRLIRLLLMNIQQQVRAHTYQMT